MRIARTDVPNMVVHRKRKEETINKRKMLLNLTNVKIIRISWRWNGPMDLKKRKEKNIHSRRTRFFLLPGSRRNNAQKNMIYPRHGTRYDI